MTKVLGTAIQSLFQYEELAKLSWLPLNLIIITKIHSSNTFLGIHDYKMPKIMTRCLFLSWFICLTWLESARHQIQVQTPKTSQWNHHYRTQNHAKKMKHKQLNSTDWEYSFICICNSANATGGLTHHNKYCNILRLKQTIMFPSFIGCFWVNARRVFYV